MASRWYPTATRLPDGRIPRFRFAELASDIVNTPEIYDPATDVWKTLHGGDQRDPPIHSCSCS
jgi:hypothetical protein